MDGSGSNEVSLQHPVSEDSDDDEAETDDILASLLAQLDNLERQQHETVTFVHDHLQQQRQAVDALRKSVRKAESVIHQKRFSRQRAKIKRLKELKAARAPSIYHVSASGTPVVGNQQLESPQVLKSGKAKEIPGGDGVLTAPIMESSSSLSSKDISRWQSVRFATDSGKATLAAESAPPEEEGEDSVMGGGDDEEQEVHAAFVSPPSSPAAPIAPPMESPEIVEAEPVVEKAAVKAAQKTIEKIVEKAAEKAAETKPRRVQKMRPTRVPISGNKGGGNIGGGSTRATTTNRKSQGGSVIGSTSSRSTSHEAEIVPVRTARRGGIGTATRSHPFKRGGLPGRSSSNEKNETSEKTFTPTTKAPPAPTGSVGFVAVNTRQQSPAEVGPSTWADEDLDDAPPLSQLAAGAGNRQSNGSSTKSLPPPRGTPPTTKTTPKRGTRAQDLPSNPVLFSSKDLRVIFGGGNPGSIIAKPTSEGQQSAVVEYEAYICLSPDAHFNPPGTMCDNAEMLDLDGQEEGLDGDIIYPVWKKIGKLWLYCGDYTLGVRRTVPVKTWEKENITVRKYWAKKVQETEWGREFLVFKGLRKHGEIKNETPAGIMGHFALPDSTKGLRLSATTLNFQTFNRPNYDLMLARARTLNPHGLESAPLSALKSNNLHLKPRSSLLSLRSSSPEVTKAVSPLRERKRRRVETTTATEDDDDDPITVVSQRRPVTTEDRGRRKSRGEVNYRIAPLSDSEAEGGAKGGKKGEVIELSEDEEEEGGGSEDGGEMVVD